MKKKAPVKLSLKRETLKSLVSPQQLKRVGGGTDDSWYCPDGTGNCCWNSASCCYTNQYSDCIDYTIFVCW